MQTLTKSNLVLAVLAAALAVPTWLVLRAERDVFTDIDRTPRLFGGFTPQNVAGLVLSVPKPGAVPAPAGPDGQRKPIERDVLQLVRGDDGWVIGAGELQGARVTANRVEEQVLEHMAAIRVDSATVAKQDADADSLAQYRLTEDTAFVVRAVDRQGQVLAELMVGREAAAGGATADQAVRGVFVRKSSSRDVVLYETKGWDRSVRANDWADRQVHQIEIGKVSRFTLRNQFTDGKELVFQKKPGSDMTWQAIEPPPQYGALRQIEFEKVLQRFQFVQASEFRGPVQGRNVGELGLVPPRIEITATVPQDGGQEKVYRLTLGGPVQDKPNEVYLTSSENPFLMTWWSHLAAPFEVDPKDLFDPPASAVEPPKEDGKEQGKEEEKDGGR